jgi:hypothetical protein
MLKDVVASLAVGASRDVTMDFAVSVATTFNAHLTGLAFLYEPLAPVADAFPAEAMRSQRMENEKAAKAAVAKFDEVVRRAPISAQLVHSNLNRIDLFVMVITSFKVEPAI